MSKNTTTIHPDYIFEISWEACNKEGGVYTDISTKAELLIPKYNDHYFFIGPDVWKKTEANPYFIEDANLLKDWKTALHDAGIYVRIGRWKEAADGLAILLDFTSFFPQKDVIFAHLWEEYRLDSITGQWDYIEPALFGYAAGKVIENFMAFHHSAMKTSHVVAHFHDWMTGVGVLYLKENAPEVATVFTTHGTVLGRAICESGKRLYSILRSYNPDQTAMELGVSAKFSLERAAVSNADASTTVSDMTAIQSDHFFGNVPDVITPSGLSGSLILDEKIRNEKRIVSRERLKTVAKALLNQAIPDDAFFLVNSGRYDFRSKGIDMFIDVLSHLRYKNPPKKDVIAWIFIPANQLGARKRLLKRLNHCDIQNPITDDYLTHSLFDEENDPVLKRIKEMGLSNDPDSKIKVIFVPAFLNGKDDIFNIPYSDLMTGMDFSVYPCYYEPWGYMPLESAARSIPTLTTNLSGVGQWARAHAGDCANGFHVVERKYDAYDNTVSAISNIIKSFSEYTEDQLKGAQKEARAIAKRAVWKNFIEANNKAWQIALQKANLRTEQFVMHLYNEPLHMLAAQESNDSAFATANVWNKILINPAVPRTLLGLLKLSKNLWWSWNHDAINLFQSIDIDLWEKVERNPIKLIEELNVEDWKHLEKDKNFVEKLKNIEQRFDNYMLEGKNKKGKQIAYFSMEYGLDNTIKIFSGGLGMLAGDYLKEASDSNVNIIGVGLLYNYGYFKQSLSTWGDQMAEYLPQQFNHLPLTPERDENGDWMTISLAFPGRTLTARIWRVDVGRIPLYLLDTHTTENTPEDKTVTDQLYGGDSNNRLKQELLLGVGGIRMLNKLNIRPDLYHCNEGHAAFIGIERINNLMWNYKLTFAQAKEIVRASSLFTTHTPVPAGHDVFTEDMLRAYIPHYAEKLNISWNDFMNLGRFKENNPGEKFSMSVLAINLSQEINGVSKIHGSISREMFAPMYPGYFPEELSITHVTNGVHYPTWTSEAWQKLHVQYFGEEFLKDQSNATYWKKIFHVPNQTLWEIRKQEKKTLCDYVRRRLQQDLLNRQEDPKMMMQIAEKINPEVLIIGFARRFATYKRALLLFNDLERLKKIVNNPERPVQFIFAGKAHPHDDGGKALIRRIIEISKMPSFIGKVLFIENYDMQLAKYLIRGVDIWLNTPTRPLEASGTSGEKAVMNGIMNLSVLDGWWAEGYRKGAGWALQQEHTYTNQDFQNDLDSEQIYYLLEEEIIPKYFARDKENISEAWLEEIRNTISQIAPHYTMKRMLDDYIKQLYSKLEKQSTLLEANHFEKAKELSDWKQRIMQAWDKITIVSMASPATGKESLSLGDVFEVSLTLDLAGLTPNDVGAEIVLATREKDVITGLISTIPMKARKGIEYLYVYECRFPVVKAGAMNFAVRMFPQNPLMPYRTDIRLMKLA